MQRYPGNASPHASPSTCTCKPDASPMQARASTCSHMQVRDCNTSSHATHIICNSHTQQTHTTLTHATLTCNSHMQHHMHLTHKHALRINLAWPAAGLHIGLALIISRACMCSSDARRMQRYPVNASTHAPGLHRVCIVFASCLHGVACTCKSDASLSEKQPLHLLTAPRRRV